MTIALVSIDKVNGNFFGFSDCLTTRDVIGPGERISAPFNFFGEEPQNFSQVSLVRKYLKITSRISIFWAGSYIEARFLAIHLVTRYNIADRNTTGSAVFEEVSRFIEKYDLKNLHLIITDLRYDRAKKMRRGSYHWIGAEVFEDESIKVVGIGSGVSGFIDGSWSSLELPKDGFRSSSEHVRLCASFLLRTQLDEFWSYLRAGGWFEFFSQRSNGELLPMDYGMLLLGHESPLGNPGAMYSSRTLGDVVFVEDFNNAARRFGIFPERAGQGSLHRIDSLIGDRGLVNKKVVKRTLEHYFCHHHTFCYYVLINNIFDSPKEDRIFTGMTNEKMIKKIRIEDGKFCTITQSKKIRDAVGEVYKLKTDWRGNRPNFSWS